MNGDHIFHLLRVVMDQRDPGISPEVREKLQGLTMQDMELLAGCRCRIFSISLCKPCPHPQIALQSSSRRVRDQGAVRWQGLFPWQAPQRRYGLPGRTPFGRAVDWPSGCVAHFCNGMAITASVRLASDQSTTR